VFGIDHIVFGTDYGPVAISPREHIDMVLALGVSSEDEDKILWCNADRLLKLGPEPAPITGRARTADVKQAPSETQFRSARRAGRPRRAARPRLEPARRRLRGDAALRIGREGSVRGRAIGPISLGFVEDQHYQGALLLLLVQGSSERRSAVAFASRRDAGRDQHERAAARSHAARDSVRRPAAPGRDGAVRPPSQVASWRSGGRVALVTNGRFRVRVAAPLWRSGKLPSVPDSSKGSTAGALQRVRCGACGAVIPMHEDCAGPAVA
jgi:hypothetical protein